MGIDLKAPGEIVRASCRLITENAVDIIFHRGLSGTRDADQLPPGLSEQPPMLGGWIVIDFEGAQVPFDIGDKPSDRNWYQVQQTSGQPGKLYGDPKSLNPKPWFNPRRILLPQTYPQKGACSIGCRASSQEECAPQQLLQVFGGGFRS